MISQIKNLILFLLIVIVVYLRGVTFNSIILISLLLTIRYAIYLWNTPGIGMPHSFNGASMRNWLKDNGYKIDYLNKKLIRKSDNKEVIIRNKGNSHEIIKLCGDKSLTSKFLSNNGIPVPPFYVCDENLSIDENLTNIYLKLKPPFVVKPIYGYGGKDVSVNIKSYDELDDKVSNLMQNLNWNNRMNNYNKCMVEEYTKGKDYRIFVHKNKVIDIVEKISGEVKGNGSLTLHELIKKYNRERKMSTKGASDLHTLKNIDKKHFLKQGYTLDSVIPNGKKVKLSAVINLSNGAISRPVNINDVDPNNIEMFENCCKLIGGVNLGIDYVSPNISLPYTSCGVVIEINGDPGFGPHRVAHKSSPEIHKKFIEALFE